MFQKIREWERQEERELMHVKKLNNPHILEQIEFTFYLKKKGEEYIHSGEWDGNSDLKWVSTVLPYNGGFCLLQHFSCWRTTAYGINEAVDKGTARVWPEQKREEVTIYNVKLTVFNVSALMMYAVDRS